MRHVMPRSFATLPLIMLVLASLACSAAPGEVGARPDATSTPSSTEVHIPFECTLLHTYEDAGYSGTLSISPGTLVGPSCYAIPANTQITMTWEGHSGLDSPSVSFVLDRARTGNSLEYLDATNTSNRYSLTA